MDISVAFGDLRDFDKTAKAHQAVLVHNARKSGDAQQLADASSMQWRYACGPNVLRLFHPYAEQNFIDQWLQWKATRTDPIPRWRFVVESFTVMCNGFVMPPTFEKLHLDPDRWLTPMLKFAPTARHPNTNDEYEMFLRLRYLVNANDRSHALRCMDMLRVFVHSEITGSVKICEKRAAKFARRPVPPSVFDAMHTVWPTIFGYLYRNRGEWQTEACCHTERLLTPVPKQSRHVHFRWEDEDIKARTKLAVRLAKVNARKEVIGLYMDPFMWMSKPKAHQVRKFFKTHGFGKKPEMPTGKFDKWDYGHYR